MSRIGTLKLMLIVLVPALASVSASGPPAQEKKPAREFEITGSQGWLDTGIDVQAGDLFRFSATGTLQYMAAKESGPEGLARNWWDLLRILPLNEANRGALIGRIGNDKASRPFLIGSGRESKAATGGRLFLGINQLANDRPGGSFHVSIEIVPGAAPQPIDESRLPKLTQEMLDGIASRVVDADGNPGDRVNFLIVGSEEHLKRALQAAGWVVVNRTPKDALIQSAIAVFSRQAYTQLPMSELMMFGRPQDYGYAMADPLVVVAARHHFRIWRAPFDVGGQTLWVGAGTHDIGFDRDQRNNSITHKIDPDTDQERDFIGKSLEATGQVARSSYMTHANPVKEAKTAHGQTFYSDGRTLVIVLRPDETNYSLTFADLFCSVLRSKNPDGGEWGDCTQYLEAPASKQVDLPRIPTNYRILIVPGLLSSCFPNTPAFKEGQEYLKQTYGMTVDFVPVPNDSCEANAGKITEFLREKMREDTRKYIVLGYSKGAPDMQVALAREKDVAKAVAAFISVAGAVGGSPVADTIPGQADRWMKQYGLPDCKGDLSEGFKSLRQSTRRDFQARYPLTPVPAYSMPAVSSQENTSKMLMQTWQILSAYGDRHDGQLARSDAIIPGSKYLGTAHADHFAIAMPFETSDEAIKSSAEKNHYPRTAMLEALVRFVIQDLEKPR